MNKVEFIIIKAALIFRQIKNWYNIRTITIYLRYKRYIIIDIFNNGKNHLKRKCKYCEIDASSKRIWYTYIIHFLFLVIYINIWEIGKSGYCSKCFKYCKKLLNSLKQHLQISPCSFKSLNNRKRLNAIVQRSKLTFCIQNKLL